MLEFKEKLIYTGSDERTSTKTRVDYQLITYLGENGQTFSTVADCQIPSDIKQLDRVEVTFKVVPGRYIQLKTLDIKKVV
ncbi:MAG: hypothetical protein AB2417_20110 [Clostridiaceae bacterium]